MQSEPGRAEGEMGRSKAETKRSKSLEAVKGKRKRTLTENEQSPLKRRMPSQSLPGTPGVSGRATAAQREAESILSDLKLQFNADYALPWSRAFHYYKRAVCKSTVEIVFNSFGKTAKDKKIYNVIFYSQDFKDSSQLYTFTYLTPVEERMLIPRKDVVAVPGHMALKPEGEEEMISKAILDKERFERIEDWVEVDLPDEDCPCTDDQAIGLTVRKFLKVAKKVVSDKEIPGDTKDRIMSALIQAAEVRVLARATMKIQQAYLDSMKGGSGREGVSALLELICDAVDGNRFWVKHHGSSDDDYGVNLTIVPAMTPVQNSKKKKHIDTWGASVTNDEMDTFSDVDDDKFTLRGRRRSGSATSCGCGSPGAIPLEAKDQLNCVPDLTVFIREGTQILPLLIVVIKSTTTDCLFEMLKHLLGALQFKDEVFGLNINPLCATFFRMKKDKSTNKICYFMKEHLLEECCPGEPRFLWNSQEFHGICEDLYKIFEYCLEATVF